jgi:hypothetical protein
MDAAGAVGVDVTVFAFDAVQDESILHGQFPDAVPRH